MSGSAATTVSPSSSSKTRNTPWVDGCWGPILRTIVFVVPTAVSTVVIISIRDAEASAGPRSGNPGGEARLGNLRAKEYDAGPCDLQNGSRTDQTLRAPSSWLRAIRA